MYEGYLATDRVDIIRDIMNGGQEVRQFGFSRPSGIHKS